MANEAWLLERVHPDDRDHALADLLAPGDRGRSEYRLQRKDGTHVWIRDQWRVITDPVTRLPSIRVTEPEVAMMLPRWVLPACTT